MTDKTGSLVIDIKGKVLSPEDREILRHPLIGGIILFAGNYESRDQVKNLCKEIRSVRKRPFLIMVDQEGGRVQRFVEEFTRLPYMSFFGRLYDEKPVIACQLARDCGWLMATELLSVGVDLSLAPVLDLNKGVSTVIGKRAFHENPEEVITLATSFIMGMNEAGMASTGKHFPGHGSVQLDSHVANPVDERSLDEIETDDLRPFIGMIKSGISAIMAAHIIFPSADSLPVSYSRYWLETILRKQLGFNGVILSDDLNMEGANISSSYTDRFRTAREAGCDYALVCNNRKGVIYILDDVKTELHMIEDDKRKLLQGQYDTKQAFQTNPRWKQTRKILEKLIAGKKNNAKSAKN